MSLTEELIQYSKDVISGDIVSCKKHKWACQRFLNDLEKQATEAFPYVFSEERAERFLGWMRLFKHTKPPMAGKFKEPELIEKFIFGNVFGWIHQGTGYRRFRKAYWQVARKNAKSQDLAITGLYGLAADGEAYAEIYVAATKKEQTRYVWGEASIIAKNNPDLEKKIITKFHEPLMQKAILHPKSGSFFTRMSKDDKRNGDGAAPHYGLIDEYHLHDTEEYYGVLTSGMTARRQPLLFIITTAGKDLNKPCYRIEYRYTSDILDPDSEVTNDRYFVMINELDVDDEGNIVDDIKDEKCWPKANPIVCLTQEGIDSIKDQVAAALDKPEKLADVLTKTFDVWVNKGQNAYLNYAKWKARGVTKTLLMPDLTQGECYIGVDLTSKIDLAAVAFVIDLGEVVAIKAHAFMPENALQQKIKTDKMPYDLWRDQGWLTTTPGEVIDDRFIAKYIDDEVKRNKYNAHYCGYDMYNATQFANVMQDDYGYEMVIVRQGIPTLHEPTKELREMIYRGADTPGKKIIHCNSPVLNMAAKNAVTRGDHNGNIMIDKEHSYTNIDPMAAVINGMLFVIKKMGTPPSVYESRGMFVLE